MKKLIVLLLAIFLVFFISDCSKNDCPEVIQPEVQELSKWQKQRFPYSKFYKLTFRIDNNGRIDTIVFYRSQFDSTTIDHGNDINTDNLCPEAYNNRYRKYLSLFISTSEDEYLEFRNTAIRPDIKVYWDNNNTGTGHGSLDIFFGSKNENFNSDSIHLIDDLTYTNCLCGTQEGPGAGNLTSFCYNYPIGFVFLHDHKKNKKWYLLDAE